MLPRKAAVLIGHSTAVGDKGNTTNEVSRCDFHRKGISATKPLVSPVGKSSLSYGGEGSLGTALALELDVAFPEKKLTPLHFFTLVYKTRRK
jgi:hypothetical protein